MNHKPLPPSFLRDDSVEPPQWYRITCEAGGCPVAWKEEEDGWVALRKEFYPPVVLETVQELWQIWKSKVS